VHLTVRGKNIDVPPALKEYAEKKLGKMDRYFGEPIHAQATMNIEKDRHIVEVTIPLDGMLVRGEEEAQDLFSAVDLVVEKIEKQLEKYKTRVNNKRVNLPQRDVPVREEYDEGPSIVRTKRFAMKPMTVDEAVLQMNLLGHDFFVFRNADTELIAVVYRRKDGNYGLLEPE